MREMISDMGGRDERFEQRLDDALAQAPTVAISEDFAARMSRLVPARQEAEVARVGYGRKSIAVSAVALLVALLVIAPHATTNSVFATGVEWILCAQLSILALWLASSRSPWSFIR